MKKYLIGLLFIGSIAEAQQIAPLTVEKIMRDPKWMGVAPSNYRWSADSKKVYFNWNPENKEKDVLYSVGLNGLKPQKEEEKALDKAIGSTLTYNATSTSALFEKGGDVYLFNPKTKAEQRLTNTVDRENAAKFLKNGSISYQRGDNLFVVDLKTNETRQLTNFVKGKKPAAPEKKSVSVQNTWLKDDQTQLFDVLKKDKKAAVPARFGFGRGSSTGTEKTIKAPVGTTQKILCTMAEVISDFEEILPAASNSSDSIWTRLSRSSWPITLMNSEVPLKNPRVVSRKAVRTEASNAWTR